MGKANKQKAKKLAKKRAKTLLKSRDDDAMVIDEETPSAPLTGRQKHAQKVAAKRALRAAKQDIQQQRWAIPKRSVDRKAERKQLVEQAKALRRENAGDATDAPAPPDDAPMSEKPTFAYAVDAKKARKAAKRRAKERAREARYDGESRRLRKTVLVFTNHHVTPRALPGCSRVSVLARAVSSCPAGRAPCST